jgi:hypothetical protein
MPVSGMGIAITILSVAIILLIVNKLFSSKKELSLLQDGNVEKIIASNEFEKNYTSNYSYSVWVYVDNWNYKYGEEKVILSKGIVEGTAQKFSPKISLGEYQNDLKVSVMTYTNSNARTQFNCSVPNIPIQSWVNILVSVNGRTLDVYLDGKLVKTCVMPGIVEVYQLAPLVITPRGGFSGYTANIKYFPNSTNPQQAWNIYRDGYGGSVLGNVMNRYKLKIAVLNNNKETASIQV